MRTNYVKFVEENFKNLIQYIPQIEHELLYLFKTKENIFKIDYNTKIQGYEIIELDNGLIYKQNNTILKITYKHYDYDKCKISWIYQNYRGINLYNYITDSSNFFYRERIIEEENLSELNLNDKSLEEIMDIFDWDLPYINDKNKNDELDFLCIIDNNYQLNSYSNIVIKSSDYKFSSIEDHHRYLTWEKTKMSKIKIIEECKKEFEKTTTPFYIKNYYKGKNND